ncbi:MAG: anti-sigma factor [Prosthecobacter sp.]
MDPRHEELAALSALDMLESDEKRVLAGAGLADKDLRGLEEELRLLGAELGLLVAPVDPPAEMKKRIRAAIRSQGGGLLPRLSFGTLIAILGWLLAVVAVIAAGFLWTERTRLSHELDAASKAIALVVPAANASEGKALTLEEELNKLRQDVDKKEEALKSQIESLKKSEGEAKDQVAKLLAEAKAAEKRNAEIDWKITMLTTDVWEYRRGVMTTVWDRLRGHGMLMLDKMTRLESGQDYQLWVIAPGSDKAVNAGVIAVDKNGAFQGEFKPTTPVSGDAKFLLTVEKKGGAESPSSAKIFSGG